MNKVVRMDPATTPRRKPPITRKSVAVSDIRYGAQPERHALHDLVDNTLMQRYKEATVGKRPIRLL